MLENFKCFLSVSNIVKIVKCKNNNITKIKSLIKTFFGKNIFKMKTITKKKFLKIVSRYFSKMFKYKPPGRKQTSLREGTIFAQPRTN